LRVCLIPLSPLHVHCLDALAMMELGPMGCHLLQPRHGLACPPTAIGRARITDAPPLPLPPLFPGRCGALAPRHHGARSLGALPGAEGAAPPFAVPGLAGPGARRDRACAGAIALCTG
jgi:hypothetical protein